MTEQTNVSPALASEPVQVEEITSTATPTIPPAGETPKVEEKVVNSEKSFTQDELEHLLGERLAREKNKYERNLREEREQRIRLEERLNSVQPPKVAIGEREPKLEDYADFDTWVTAKAEYVAEKKINARLAENESRMMEQRAEMAQQQSIENFKSKVVELEKENPGSMERLMTEGNELPMTQAMQFAIHESPIGAKVAIYLLDHPDETVKIADMTPIGAVRALTLIEEGLKKPVAVTQATPPITPTGSRSTSIKSLVDVKDFDEFSKRRAAQIAKRR